MIRFLILSGLSASLIATAAIAAPAAPAPIDKAFGNTIISTYPDGRTAKLWLKRGGTYQAEGRRHDLSNGRWTIKNAKLCLRQHTPPTLPISYCTPLPQDGLNHAWAAKAVTGEPIRVQLVKGHV